MCSLRLMRDSNPIKFGERQSRNVKWRNSPSAILARQPGRSVPDSQLTYSIGKPTLEIHAWLSVPPIPLSLNSYVRGINYGS
jgi:hypothetical protein